MGIIAVHGGEDVKSCEISPLDRLDPSGELMNSSHLEFTSLANMGRKLHLLSRATPGLAQLHVGGNSWGPLKLRKS